MAFEAFDAGVAPGGLRDRNEVKILVCYLLRELHTPLSFDQLNEILQIDGLVNYFELAQSVKELLETGHIDLVKGEGGPYYKATKLGAGTAALFERRLPLTVREKAVRAAVRLLARVRREAENHVTITERPQGDYEVTCRILDNNDALMSISLLVPARDEAQAVKKEFLADPSAVYRGMLALLTGDRSAFVCDTPGQKRPKPAGPETKPGNTGDAGA